MRFIHGQPCISAHVPMQANRAEAPVQIPERDFIVCIEALQTKKKEQP